MVLRDLPSFKDLPSFRNVSSFRPSGSVPSSSIGSEMREETQVTDHLQNAIEKIEKESMRYKQRVLKPWLDEEGQPRWWRSRICIARWVQSQSFEICMGFVIFVNIVLMIIETNSDAACFPDYSSNIEGCSHHSRNKVWLQVCIILLQIIYTVECALRAYVELGDYLWNWWNQIDLWTAVLGWIAVALNSVNLNILRILRVLRLVRVGRLVISVPELYVLLSGLTTSFKPIFFGSIMLISVILVWSIIVVELLHPLNSEMQYVDCPHCSEGFKSVYVAALTLFSQIVAGDAWGSISIPLAQAHWWASPILFFIMMTVSLGVMNLILATVVEKAAEARENDQERKSRLQDEVRQKDMIELAVLCDRMDNDGSGTISLQELLDGYDSDQAIHEVMKRMNIDRDDMQTIFRGLDVDAFGELDYVEFCHHLGSCKKQDPLMLSILTKYAVMEVRTLIEGEVMRVLREQTDMIRDQFDLLCKLPGCEATANELKQKSLARISPESRRRQSLRPRRQRESGGREYIRASLAEQASSSISSYHMRPGSKDNFHEQVETISESMSAVSKTFQGMQNQLETLLSNAEQLATELSENINAAENGALLPLPRVTEERDASESVEESIRPAATLRGFDQRFVELLRKVNHRSAREDALQKKLMDMMKSISSMLEEPHVVQHEL